MKSGLSGGSRQRTSKGLPSKHFSKLLNLRIFGKGCISTLNKALKPPKPLNPKPLNPKAASNGPGRRRSTRLRSRGGRWRTVRHPEMDRGLRVFEDLGFWGFGVNFKGFGFKGFGAWVSGCAVKGFRVQACRVRGV